MLQHGLGRIYKGIAAYGSQPLSALSIKFDSATVMRSARAAQKTVFQDLNYPNKKQYLAFPSYTCMSSFAEQNNCKNILEIGAGLSTAVWATLAEKTGAQVCTLDANLSRMRSYVRNTRYEALVAKHVELIEGVSVHCDEFVDFYSDNSRTSYGGIEIAAFRNHIDEFQSRNCSIKRRHKVSRIANHRGWSARDLMTTKSSLSLPRRLLDLFSANGDFNNDISFMKDAEARGVAGRISELSQDQSPWDLIFFDSGELASMLEWTRLKNTIAVGGFAAFHDIFFPKSIKNIIPCAEIMADPDWDIVFCDDTTKQGLLIARRLR